MSESTPNSTTQAGKLLPWFTAILLVVGAAVLAAMYWTQNVTVSGVEIVGNYYTETEKIALAADIPEGIKPDSLDLDQVVARVEALNYVKSVIPYVEPSGDLRLTVKERSPIAMLVKGGDRIYVDADGVRLSIIDGKTSDLPLVYGFDATLRSGTLQTEGFKQIRDFLVDAQASEFGWVTISEVVFSEEEGVVALSHENGVKLLFGTNDFGAKLRNWEAFYSEVIRVKGIQTMQQVDLRFTNQVVTRES